MKREAINWSALTRTMFQQRYGCAELTVTPDNFLTLQNRPDNGNPTKKSLAQEINVFVDRTGKNIPGEIRTIISFGGICLVKVIYAGEGIKDVYEWNLDELHEKGWVPSLLNNKDHKLNGLGVEVARMYLNGVQALCRAKRVESERIPQPRR